MQSHLMELKCINNVYSPQPNMLPFGEGEPLTTEPPTAWGTNLLGQKKTHLSPLVGAGLSANNHVAHDVTAVHQPITEELPQRYP